MSNFKFKKLNQRGQSAIEFIIVTIVVFFFLLFYMSFAITLVASEYVDYATFMSARTFKSGNDTRENQEKDARKVFGQYLDPISSVIRSPQVRFSDAGATSSYEVDLFYLPPLFIKNGAPPVSRLSLESEALLGRDPAINDCLNFFSGVANQLGFGGTFLANVMEDNGC